MAMWVCPNILGICNDIEVIRCKSKTDAELSYINHGVGFCYLCHIQCSHFITLCLEGAQWLSGRVLDSRPRGCGFEPHQRHCAVSLNKKLNPSLALVQPRKTRPFIPERLLMGWKESNQTNKHYVWCSKPRNWPCYKWIMLLQRNYRKMTRNIGKYLGATWPCYIQIGVKTICVIKGLHCNWTGVLSSKQWMTKDSNLSLS